MGNHSALYPGSPSIVWWALKQCPLHRSTNKAERATLGCLFVQLVVGNPDFFISATFVSLFVNVLVTPALIVWIWRAKRKVTLLLGDSVLEQTQVPYNRLIRILTESALPPLLLGISQVALILSSGYPSVLLNMLWGIFTVSRLFGLLLDTFDLP
jgi:hypothetical protein